MEKKVFEFGEPALEKEVIGENVILIRPYLTYGEKIALAKNYLENFFNAESETAIDGYDYLGAETTLKLSVVDLCTNISLDGLNINVLLAHDVFDAVLNSVNGFYELKNEIARLVEIAIQKKNHEKSLESTLRNFFEKANEIVEQFASISPEDSEMLKKSIKAISEMNPPIKEKKKKKKEYE